MNITLTLLGLVLAPIILILIQKTVQQYLIKTLLNEVTHELVKNPLLIMGPVTGVAREVVAPNNGNPQITDGLSLEFSGATTSFIEIKVGDDFTKNKDPFEAVSVKYRKSKRSKFTTCLVYKEGDDIFVKFKKRKKYYAVRLWRISKNSGDDFIRHVRVIVRGELLSAVRRNRAVERLEIAAI